MTHLEDTVKAIEEYQKSAVPLVMPKGKDDLVFYSDLEHHYRETAFGRGLQRHYLDSKTLFSDKAAYHAFLDGMHRQIGTQSWGLESIKTAARIIDNHAAAIQRGQTALGKETMESSAFYAYMNAMLGKMYWRGQTGPMYAAVLSGLHSVTDPKVPKALLRVESIGALVELDYNLGSRTSDVTQATYWSDLVIKNWMENKPQTRMDDFSHEREMFYKRFAEHLDVIERYIARSAKYERDGMMAIKELFDEANQSNHRKWLLGGRRFANMLAKISLEAR
jgi:hypothetical protein